MDPLSNSGPDRPLRRRNARYCRDSQPIAPWFAARLLSLFLAWCWGVISGASGINALVKSNRDKNAITRAITGPSAAVNISIRDVYIPGVFITVFSFLIVFFTTIFLILTILRPGSFRRTFSIQGAVLLVCSICLLVNVIVETVFVARRRAKVSATVAGASVPQSVIDGVQRLLGITSVYRKIHYLRNAVIFAWITFLLTFISSIILFTAASRTTVKPINQNVGVHQPFTAASEKPHQERGALGGAPAAPNSASEAISPTTPTTAQEQATSEA